ncbi:CLAVATA3/ESR (CLE)-related protein 41-like, partial [Quillaja saponaria]
FKLAFAEASHSIFFPSLSLSHFLPLYLLFFLYLLSLGAGSWILNPCGLLGGWFLLQNCMAAPKTPSSSISETFTKSHPFFQFLSLLFIFLLLINLSNPMNPSTVTSSSSSSNSIKQSESTPSTTNLNPHKTQSSHRKFGVEAHEVPSGPNPISNR